MLQVVPRYNEVTTSPDSPLVYEYFDPIFQRMQSSYTTQTSWAGWMKETTTNTSSIYGIYRLHQNLSEPAHEPIGTNPDAINVVNGVWLVDQAAYGGQPDELMLNYGYIDDEWGGYHSRVWISENKIPRENYQWIGVSF